MTRNKELEYLRNTYSIDQAIERLRNKYSIEMVRNCDEDLLKTLYFALHYTKIQLEDTKSDKKAE